MEWYVLSILLVSTLLAVLIIGVPLYAGIGLVSFSVILYFEGLSGAINTLSVFTFSKIFNYLFVTVPLFVFMAEVIMFSGIGADLYEMMHKWLCSVRGGLAMASTSACAVFGAMCGSTSPTVAAIGLVAIPEMLKRGYDKRLATGCVATAGGLATLIPPSIIMILYAFVAEQSVGQMFIAGIIPGIILTAMLMGSIWIRVKLNPALAAVMPAAPWKERLFILRRVWPILILIFLCLASIYLGFATPTEAAGLGAFGAVCLGVIMRRFTIANARVALLRTVQVTSFIFMVILSALLFGYVASYLGVTAGLTEWMINLPVSPYAVLALLQLMYLLLGTMLEQGSIVLITTPVVMPIVRAFGFDPIWYGILLVVNMEMAGLTPPVGFNLYVVKSIVPEDVTLADIIRGAIPFVVVELVFLIILVIFPQLALWLPHKVMKPRLL